VLWCSGARTAGHAGHDMQLCPRARRIRHPLRLPGTEGLFGVLDVPAPLTIVGKTIRHPILPANPCRCLPTKSSMAQTFLNPVLRVRNGAALRVKFWNALDETSIIHWHG